MCLCVCVMCVWVCRGWCGHVCVMYVLVCVCAEVGVGMCVRQLTSGSFMVSSVERVDTVSGHVYFHSNIGSPLSQHVCRVGLVTIPPGAFSHDPDAANVVVQPCVGEVSDGFMYGYPFRPRHMFGVMFGTSVHVYACVCMCLYVGMCVCMCVCACLSVCECLCLCVCSCVRVAMYVCVYVCECLSMCVCVGM